MNLTLTRFSSRLLRSILLGGFGAALGTSSALAYSENIGATGPWSVLFTEVESGLKLCSTAQLYDSGAWIMFDQASDGEILLSVYAPEAPAHPKNQGVAPIALAFDNAEALQIGAQGYPVALNGLEGVVIKLADSEYAQLSAAETVTVSFGAYTAPEMSLDGFADAQAAVDACIESYF